MAREAVAGFQEAVAELHKLNGLPNKVLTEFGRQTAELQAYRAAAMEVAA